MGFLALFFVHARAQHLHRLFFVLVLAASVLAGHHNACWQVGNAHGRVRGVDVLSARTRRTVHVDFQVARLDLDIDLGRLRQYRDGRCAGVNAAAAFGHGHALHTVDAAFIFQLGENAIALDRDNNFLEPAHIGRADRDRFDLPPLPRGIAFVHAVQVTGEQRRFITARASPDFEHGRPVIGGIFRQERNGQSGFGFAQLVADILQFLNRHLVQVGVGGILRHMLQGFDFLAQSPDIGRRLGDRFQLRIFLGRRDKGIALQLPRSHPRLKLGKARFNKRDTLRGDFGHASD